MNDKLRERRNNNKKNSKSGISFHLKLVVNKRKGKIFVAKPEI